MIFGAAGAEEWEREDVDVAWERFRARLWPLDGESFGSISNDETIILTNLHRLWF